MSFKISIITIVRNGMPYIKETVESVTNQDYTNIEYIVIDSISTDGTVEYLRSCENKISKFVSEKDAGIADAFNKGLGLATGDYIMFLNADDKLYSAESISTLVKHTHNNNHPTFLYGDCEVLERVSSQQKYIASINFDLRNILKGSMPPHPSMLAHKNYFLKYGSFDTQFKIAMDFEWFIRGIKSSSIVHIPYLITSVRDGGVSTGNQIKVISEIIAALKKNNYLISQYARFSLWTYYLARYIAKIISMKLGIYKIIKKN